LGPIDGSPCDTLGLDVVSIIERDGANNFSFLLSPNPTNSHIQIMYELPILIPIKWSLYNQLGQLVKEKHFNSQQLNEQISLSGIESGLYFYVFQSDGIILKTDKLLVKQ